jgi:hypothetical protein
MPNALLALQERVECAFGMLALGCKGGRGRRALF